jgi:hypothetical protein
MHAKFLVDTGLAFGFVHGVDLLDGLGFHSRFEAHGIADGVVKGMPHATGTLEFAIALRHILDFYFVRI